MSLRCAAYQVRHFSPLTKSKWESRLIARVCVRRWRESAFLNASVPAGSPRRRGFQVRFKDCAWVQHSLRRSLIEFAMPRLGHSEREFSGDDGRGVRVHAPQIPPQPIPPRCRDKRTTHSCPKSSPVLRFDLFEFLGYVTFPSEGERARLHIPAKACPSVVFRGSSSRCQYPIFMGRLLLA